MSAGLFRGLRVNLQRYRTNAVGVSVTSQGISLLSPRRFFALSAVAREIRARLGLGSGIGWIPCHPGSAPPIPPARRSTPRCSGPSAAPTPTITGSRLGSRSFRNDSDRSLTCKEMAIFFTRPVHMPRNVHGLSTGSRVDKLTNRKICRTPGHALTEQLAR